jgi:hypothetical protein
VHEYLLTETIRVKVLVSIGTAKDSGVRPLGNEQAEINRHESDRLRRYSKVFAWYLNFWHFRPEKFVRDPTILNGSHPNKVFEP